jgi:hypothetical protein
MHVSSSSYRLTSKNFCQQGHYITKKGQPGDSMFFITLGSVAVRVDGKSLELKKKKERRQRLGIK